MNHCVGLIMFKDKSTGFYGFYNQTHGCPVNDPSNSGNETWKTNQWLRFPWRQIDT